MHGISRVGAWWVGVEAAHAPAAAPASSSATGFSDAIVVDSEPGDGGVHLRMSDAYLASLASTGLLMKMANAPSASGASTSNSPP